MRTPPGHAAAGSCRRAGPCAREGSRPVPPAAATHTNTVPKPPTSIPVSMPGGDGSRPLASSARVVPVEVPVAHHNAQPVRPLPLPRPHGEAADDALASLLIAVEEIDGERLPRADGFEDGGALGVVRLPDGALPEADVAGRNVQVAGLRPELRGIRAVERQTGVLRLRDSAPAEDHGDAGSHVAQRGGQVDDPVELLDVGPAAVDRRPVVV